jgi:hypothetical protein
MKRIALAALAAAALFSGAAHADETFDSFRDFCVAGRGASATALAAADAAGWTPVPQQFLDQLPKADFQAAQGRMRSAAGGASLLLTARGNMPGVGPVGICAIGVLPASASDLAGQLQAFAAVPKQVVTNLPEGFYAWRDENGGHVSVDRGSPDFRTQVAGGTALVATTRTTPQMTMILLMSSAQ